MDVKVIFEKALSKLPLEFEAYQLRIRARELGSGLSGNNDRKAADKYLKAWDKIGLIKRLDKGRYQRIICDTELGENDIVPPYTFTERTELGLGYDIFVKSFREGDVVQCTPKNATIAYADCRGCLKRLKEVHNLVFCDANKV